MTAQIKAITATAPQTERTVDALEAVQQALYDHLKGLPIAPALGVLELAKQSLLTGEQT